MRLFWVFNGPCYFRQFRYFVFKIGTLFGFNPSAPPISEINLFSSDVASIIEEYWRPQRSAIVNVTLNKEWSIKFCILALMYGTDRWWSSSDFREALGKKAEKVTNTTMGNTLWDTTAIWRHLLSDYC